MYVCASIKSVLSLAVAADEKLRYGVIAPAGASVMTMALGLRMSPLAEIAGGRRRTLGCGPGSASYLQDEVLHAGQRIVLFKPPFLLIVTP
jgi:hypothetical protein